MKKEISSVFQKLNYNVSKNEMAKTLQFFSEERNLMRNAIEDLSWDKPEVVQNVAIELLSGGLFSYEYIFLVMPGKYKKEIEQDGEKYYLYPPKKDKWENAAKVILRLGWPKVKPILVPLFIWLLDPNWPGSEQIRQFILSLPPKDVKEAMNTIANNPQPYTPCDYYDLMDVIEELKEDLNRKVENSAR